MNIYVCYSTDDMDVVKEKIQLLDPEKNKLNILILDNKDPIWKIHCLPKIKNSQMMIFFAGKNSHSSPYIGWELDNAIKYNIPVYTVKLDEENEKHSDLIIKNKYSGKEKEYDSEVSIEMLNTIIKNYNEENYHVINEELNDGNAEVFFKQYKFFLQTSEDLVERRQNANNFYITINSAFIALFGTLLTFEIEMFYKVIIGAIFAVMGIVLSLSWIKMLDSYGMLNTSKMKIIGCLERNLPASLYAAEWEAMSDRLNKKKYVSFTESEKQIPKIFIVLYVLVLIGLLCYFFFAVK